MMGDKALITYKRKRSFASFYDDHGFKRTFFSADFSPEKPLRRPSSNLEAAKDKGKLNMDDEHCRKCGAFDVNENLLSCAGCSGTYHLRCTDPALQVGTYHLCCTDSPLQFPEENWLCSACMNHFGKQKQPEEASIMKINKGVECDVGSVELQPTYISAGDALDGRIPFFNKINRADLNCASACNVTSGSTSFEFTETDARIACLSLSVERICSSGLPCDPIYRDKSVKASCNNEHPKENSSKTLITFCRRAKMKQDIGEAFSKRKLEVKEQQFSSSICSKYALGGSSRYQGSFQTSGGNELHDFQRDEVTKAEEDAGHESLTAGQLLNNKMAGKLRQKSYSQRRRRQKSKQLAISMHASEKITAPCVSPQTMEPSGALCHYEPSMGAVPAKQLESETSDKNWAIVPFNKDNDVRRRCLEWSENLDKAFRERKKDKSTVLSQNQDGIVCRKSSKGKANLMVPIDSVEQYQQNQELSRDLTTQGVPSQERMCLRKYGEIGSSKQHERTSETYSMWNRFLGLNMPATSGSPSDSVTDFHTMSSKPMSGIGVGIDKRFSLLASNRDSSSRPDQMTQDVSGTRHKERLGSSPGTFRKYQYKWSEGELDFLWIGVRRHGLHNWDAMLNDPRLCFLESRTAEDLAQQWAIEERKLLDGTLLHPLRQSKPELSPPVISSGLLAESAARNRFGACDPLSHISLELPKPVSETKLSLGEVYHRRRGHFFHTSGLGSTNPASKNLPIGCSSVSSFCNSSMYPWAPSRQHKPIRAQNPMYHGDHPFGMLQNFGEGTSNRRQSAGLPASTGLPHWLKEAVNIPPRPSDQVFPPGTSSIAHSDNSLGSDLQIKTGPPSIVEPLAPAPEHRGRGILKRRRDIVHATNMCGPMASDAFISANEPRKEAKLGLIPAPGQISQNFAADRRILDQNTAHPDLNKESSGLATPDDLVIVDSDASSEETISDDENNMI